MSVVFEIVLHLYNITINMHSVNIFYQHLKVVFCHRIRIGQQPKRIIALECQTNKNTNRLNKCCLLKVLLLVLRFS